MMTPSEIDQLRNYLIGQSSGLERVTPDFLRAVFTDHGKAVSMQCAINDCISDYKRTAAFIEAVKRAIADKGPRVLYIGAGPLGVLLLPALMGDRSLCVTFVEINKAALDVLSALCEKLGLNEKHNLRFVCADACELPLYESGEFDVLVTETMNRFLDYEPFVSIVLANIHNLREGGALIPERVRLSVNDQDAFVIDEKMARGHKDFEARLIEAPTNRLECKTEVCVYGDLFLRGDDSLITRRKIVDIPNYGTIRARYAVGKYPQLKLEAVING